jgi:CDP-diacylglycerol--serine O-phosphatidyltransferase
MAKSPHFRRGIYLLPTLFTVGNMFCGYSSIVHSSIGKLEMAAVLIVIAGILDGLDGRIARLTGTTSEFGIQFDSLADIVSFGLAPALLAFHWGLPANRIGWSLAFLYVVCAAMRLARYNIQKPAADKRYFVGLPSPMAGGVLACLVFRYRSFHEVDLGNRRSYIYVLPIAAIVVAVVLSPRYVLLVCCTVYLVSSPLLYRYALRAAVSVLPDDSGATSEVVDEPALR